MTANNRRSHAFTTMSATNPKTRQMRQRVINHPLVSTTGEPNSNSNSPLVPGHIVTTTPKKQKPPPPKNRTPTGEEQASAVSSSHSSLTTHINTASLIQSAARSVLDSVYTPTSTNNVSDDEDDDGTETRQQQQQQQQQQNASSPHLPTLQSLQRELLPAMPDEQDRKRFVGCFAAILASSYDYDVAHGVEDTQANRAESYAYLDRHEQGSHDDDDDDDDSDGEDYYSSSHHPKSSSVDTTVASSTLDADHHGEESFLSQSCSTSFEYADYSFIETELNNLSQQQQQQQQSSSMPPREGIKKSTLARNRHRKRRYDVLSKLLLSSAELLLLDKSQSRAFLPMLARLLVPPTASEKQKSDRIRKRKQQLQRRQHYQQQLQEYHQQQQQQQQEALSSSRTSTPTKSCVSTPANSPHRQSPATTTTDKGINRYHFSPTTSIPQSQSIPLPPQPPQDDFDNRSAATIDTAKSPAGGGDDSTSLFVANELDDEEHLRPFLESLNPGAGFRCLSLFLLQHLLNSAEGYDARARHVIKKLGVTVLVQDMERERDLEMIEEESSEEGSLRSDNSSKKAQKKRRRRQRRGMNREDLIGPATRKFEALEHSIAVRLIRLSKEQERLQKLQNQQQGGNRKNRQQPRRQAATSSGIVANPAAPVFSREQWVRGLKIGSAGLVAGTIFAVTGGLAAPGIAAGVAAIAGSTAATAAIATIVSSTTTVTAIFGVGGGSLAAYKMNRRTQGLTDFEFRRQDKIMTDKDCSPEEEEEAQAELFSTVCISGWLTDQHDFQRPWGIAPTNPRIRNRLELLERFYSVYRPDHVSKCEKILSSWKGEERQLWDLLKQKYGRDPDNLYPILSTHENGFHRGLTLEQDEALNDLFVELGYVQKQSDISHTPTSAQSPASALEAVRERLAHPFSHTTNTKPPDQKGAGYSGNFHFSSSKPAAPYQNLLDESVRGPGAADGLSCASSGFDSLASSQIPSQNSGGDESEEYVPPRHLHTVWDYHSKYGGELYTVKWESDMLIELCDSVSDLAFDVINGATAQILRQTALHTLISAVAVPYALASAANLIDGPWTLAVERADEAGKELAKSLLFSRAGHRPVTLIGFSFGARAIYSCLKELAKYQEKWETSREKSKNDSSQTSDAYPWTLREPASIVEDVILMGLPNHLSLGSWKACRQVIGGRLVNCYSRKDMILSLMFQIRRLQGVLRPVCGTCVVNVPGVENVDVSDLIAGHQDYCLATGEILKRVHHGQPYRMPNSDDVSQNIALIGM